MPETLVEYTLSHKMIAAATRLREAWSMPVFDVVELHVAAMGLMWVTGTADLETALAVLDDVDSGHAFSD